MEKEGKRRRRRRRRRRRERERERERERTKIKNFKKTYAQCVHVLKRITRIAISQGVLPFVFHLLPIQAIPIIDYIVISGFSFANARKNKPCLSKNTLKTKYNFIVHYFLLKRIKNEILPLLQLGFTKVNLSTPIVSNTRIILNVGFTDFPGNCKQTRLYDYMITAEIRKICCIFFKRNLY